MIRTFGFSTASKLDIERFTGTKVEDGTVLQLGQFVPLEDHERAMEEMRGLLREWQNQPVGSALKGNVRYLDLCKRTDALLGGYQ